MITARTRLGLDVLGTALILGVVGDTLLRAMPGLNVTICTTLLVSAAVLLVRRHRLTPSADAPWLALTALLLGAAFVRRDAEMLAGFDALALLLTLALGAASLQGERIAALQPLDHLRVPVTGGLGTLTGGIALVAGDIGWTELSGRGGRFAVLRAVGLGVLLAVPLLLVFGILFASADRVFGNLAANLLAFDPEVVASHTLLIGFLTALAAGYLRWSLVARPAVIARPAADVRMGIIPVGTALGLLTLLFLVFVVVQLRYFFGGAALIEQTTDLTYAAYARHGFFELVTASGLLLPVLIGANHLVRQEPPAAIAVLRRISGVLLVLLAVVIASALERMRLYVQAYGLSEDRLYATAFMIFLTGVFAWLAATVMRGRGHRFAFGALVQALVVLTGLHLLNPDAFIVRTNLNRAAQPAAERPFDAEYALSLGADAVPPLLEVFERLDAPTRCVVAAGLLERWSPADSSDWRSWNWSRSRARRLVSERAQDLRALSCPPTSPE